MQIKFNDKINNVIKILALEAERFGVKIYFVGGLVRDVLMGKAPLDIDILVEGNAIDFVKSLDFIKVKSIHEDFGTVKAEVSGIDIDFASTRIEEYPKSGCLPHVTKIGCDIKDDLIRRDFTINAIYIDENYNVIDPTKCGINDLNSRHLRFIKDPLTSIKEDPLRILRAYRFIKEYNLSIDEKDLRILKENEDLLKHLNVNKIKEEEKKLKGALKNYEK